MKHRIESMSWRTRQKKKLPERARKGKKTQREPNVSRELQDTMKHNNICIIGTPEGDEKEQGIENLFEKAMMENIPNLMREKVTQVQEAQRVTIKRNPKRPTPRHIIIKMAKFKDKERIIMTPRKRK